MKQTFYMVLWALLPLSLTAGEPRIVSVGGNVTEVFYALGLDSFVVGVDVSSVYPEEAADLPQVGYNRTLSAEGVLSLNPTHLVCRDDAGPPAVIRQIERAGVRVIQVPSEPSVENIEQVIRIITEAFGDRDRGEELVGQLHRDLAEVEAAIESTSKPKVLFIYARAGGVLNVSGRETAADKMIALAGAENAITGYDGFKPLTPEAAILAQPDVVLVTTRGLEAAGSEAALLSHPGLRQTPAAQNQRIVAMDDLLLLGFGPRLGEAVRELAKLLHGERPASVNGVSP